MDVAKEIEDYIAAELVFGDSKDSLSRDDDLLAQGIIDSMGVVKLVGFLEERFSIQVSDMDIVPEYFRDINSLASLVEGKLQK